MAETIDPYNTSAYNWKQLIENEQQSPEEIANVLQKELENRPTDTNLRIRLLRHFIRNNRVCDAYDHVNRIETENLFSKNLMWYETIIDILIRYKKQEFGNLTSQFWYRIISISDKVLGLILDERSDNVKEHSQYINQLFLFDQLLHEASQNIGVCPDKLLSNEFLNHYRGQLFFHFATTILKQAKLDSGEFKEAAAITLPLLFASYELNPVNLQAPWINQLPESQKKWLQMWRLDGAFRCSQSGHILLAAAKDRKYVVIAKATQHSFGMWQERIFKKVFANREQQLQINSSYFVNNPVELDLLLPTAEELLVFDEESLLVSPDCLQHYIWLSGNNELSEMRYLPFEGLKYSVKNLSNCSVETLSLSDVQAFVYCASWCSEDHLKDLESASYNADRPKVLPESITGQLGSLEQEKFLAAAYKMHKNEPVCDSEDIRSILIRGLETVRCIGKHGMEVSLLVKLADIFARKAEKSSRHSEIEFNNARAELYWKSAFTLLEQLKNNELVTYPTNRLFACKSKVMPLSEICRQIDKAKLFFGTVALKRKEYDKALSMLKESKDPFASFRQAETYKQMADQLLRRNGEGVTKELENQIVVLIKKARDCLYWTLDRLRLPSADKEHPLNGRLTTEIERVEELLTDFESTHIDRNECERMSNENTSSDESEEEYTLANNSHHCLNVSTLQNARKDTKNVQSTALRSNRTRLGGKVTTEKLDVQLRQLYAFKDFTASQVLEQNSTVLESHKSLVNEMRVFKEAVHNLSAQVGGLKNSKSALEELTDLRKSVEQLKKSVGELRSLRNVSETVCELRKDIAEMKKDDTGKRRRYDDLGDECNPKYNPNLHRNNYSNRFAQVSPPHAAWYPPAYHPAIYGGMAYYGYPNLGLSQSGLLYGTEPQPYIAAMTHPSTQGHPSFPTYAHTPAPAVQPPPILASSSANPSLLIGQSLPQIISESRFFESTPTVSSTASTTSLTSTKSAPINEFSIKMSSEDLQENLQLHEDLKCLLTAAVANVSVVGKPADELVSTELPISYVEDKISSIDLGSQKEKSSGVSSDLISLLEFPSDDISPTEVTLFERQAILFVFLKALNEFKVKGSGPFMILGDKDKNSFRILMKNEQGESIANYYITVDLKIASVKDNLFYWRNLDYANGKLTFENVCLKFKNSEDADAFYTVFEQCQKNGWNIEKTASLKTKTEQNEDIARSESGNVFEGFVFSSRPSLEPKEDELIRMQPENRLEKIGITDSLLANFSFRTANSSKLFEMNANAGNPKIQTIISPTPPEILEPISPHTCTQAGSSLTEEFVPSAEFQPVIPLPDIVEVKTGEENAEVLFNCRAKLLRFDSEKKEWKERGLGNMKILREKSLVRLLMRREQIHKVCCNHQLLKNMNFQYMPYNFRALTWCAQDYADEVLKPETFAIKFKTEEQASDFLKCILSSQASLNDENSLGSKGAHKKEETFTQYPDLFDKFKLGKGNWECKNCFVSNNTDKCVACESPKIPIVKFVSASPPNRKECHEVTAISTELATGLGNDFKPKAGTWECQCCLIRNQADVPNCVSCDFPKDDAALKNESSSSSTLGGIKPETPFKFTFGLRSGSSDVTRATLETPNAFKFGSSTSSSAGVFGVSNATFIVQSSTKLDTSGVSGTTDSIAFGTPDVREIEFKARSPKNISGHGIDCSYAEVEDEDNYFKPAIPLPKAIEVKTGEENEEVLFCHRAKLFKFIAGEWKGRGIGELKILRNEEDGKLRVLMRRDRVLKICLNHALTANVKYLPKDDKTWIFNAADFSEEEVNHDKFCLRFQNADIAKEFKAAVAESLEAAKATEEVDSSDEGSGVEFVLETSTTADESKEAQRLGLPSKFFAYKRLPLCTCDQCAKDDEYFEGTVLNGNSYEDASPSTPTGKVSDRSSESAVFLTPCSSSESPKHESLRDLLAKPLIFNRSTTNPGSIEKSTRGTDTPISSSTTIAGNMFGSKFGISTNLFGVKSSSADNTALKPFSFLEVPGRYQGGSTSPSLSSSSAISTNGIVENKCGLVSESKATVTNTFAVSTADSKNLFGTPQLTKTLFGSVTSTSNSMTFNTASSKIATNVFPAPNAATNSLDDQSSTTTTAGLMFGSNTNANIFGSVPVKSPEENSIPITRGNVSPFGPINTGRLFGNSNISSSGSGAKFEFGKCGGTFGQPAEDKAKEANEPVDSATRTDEPKISEPGEDVEVILKCSDDVSFSSLARQSRSVAPTFQPPSGGGGDIQPFAFLGAGTPVFGVKKKQDTQPDTSVEAGEANHEVTADEDYDPHYDPIIPMPDVVVVSTGEEEETAVFDERAKLFRYDPDSKEWKERGVGQMKILHHPENGTYRFILRREQVHKIVLNQLITPSLDVQPMATSDKACMWAGYNYVDEQMNLEKLAVKFKYQETAEKFLEHVQTCLIVVKETRHDNLPSTIHNYGLENISSDSDPQDEIHHENDYYEDDDSYDDEDDYEPDRCDSDPQDEINHENDYYEDDDSYDDEGLTLDLEIAIFVSFNSLTHQLIGINNQSLQMQKIEQSNHIKEHKDVIESMDHLKKSVKEISDVLLQLKSDINDLKREMEAFKQENEKRKETDSKNVPKTVPIIAPPSYVTSTFRNKTF